MNLLIKKTYIHTLQIKKLLLVLRTTHRNPIFQGLFELLSVKIINRHTRKENFASFSHSLFRYNQSSNFSLLNFSRTCGLFIFSFSQWFMISYLSAINFLLLRKEEKSISILFFYCLVTSIDLCKVCHPYVFVVEKTVEEEKKKKKVKTMFSNEE